MYMLEKKLQYVMYTRISENTKISTIMVEISEKEFVAPFVYQKKKAFSIRPTNITFYCFSLYI